MAEPPVTGWQLVYIPAEPMAERSSDAIVKATTKRLPSLAEELHMVSIVPRVPLKRADDLVGRIEALVADAQAKGQKSIAYFLNMALIELESN
ncbi:hypothetical protein QO058_30205 (plasmid) [Bosea vestrisii]|uniref:hypothetical protein n=1 Tax=Bosea vestrisii TaxID=151416 RepID=UPI0024DF9529|nr:hypothetical protein [Bosea vestrisii]WID99676.1 hypothetical protein QO058_30205 [Bosea vestrisii]